MSLRTAITRTVVPMTRTFRPAVVRQLSRRNFMVGLQPGVEERAIAREAGNAVSMIGGYFGLMGGAFCVGSLAGAVRSEVENIVARQELMDEYQREMR